MKIFKNIAFKARAAWYVVTSESVFVCTRRKNHLHLVCHMEEPSDPVVVHSLKHLGMVAVSAAILDVGSGAVDEAKEIIANAGNKP